MAERVTLDLFLNDRGALTSIEDLKAGIQAANKELETVQIGSQRYVELKGAIASANSELANQRKQLKGLTSEEFTSSFARIGAGIASSFAVSTAALNLFGIESKNVSEAAVDAQNAISIAIGSRQVLEGILSLRMLSNNALEKIRLALVKANILATEEQVAATTAETVAEEVNTGAKAKNTVSQTANTAATKKDTVATVADAAAKTAAGTATGFFAGALRTLYTVMMANPFLAILTLIGGLVAAVVLLKDETDAAEQAQKDYNKALAEGSAQAATAEVSISSLIDVVRNENRSLKEREAAYRLVQKEVAGLKDLTLDQALATDKLRKAYELEMAVVREKAKVDAAAQIYTSKLTELYEFQANATDRNALKSDEYQDILRALRFANDLLNDSTEDYTNALVAQNVFIDENTNKKGGNTAATNEQVLANNRLKLQLDILNQYLKDQLNLYKDLGKVIEVEDRLPDIVDKVNDAYRERAKILKNTGNQFKQALLDIGYIEERLKTAQEQRIESQELFNQQLEEGYKKVAEGQQAISLGDEPVKRLFVLRDELLDVSDDFSKQIEKDYDNFFLTIGLRTETFSKYMEQLRKSYLNLFAESKISPQALNSVDALIENLKSLNVLVREGIGLEKQFGKEFLNTYLNALRQVLAVKGEILYTYDEESQSVKEIVIDRQNYIKNLQYVTAFETGLRKATIRGLTKLVDSNKEVFRQNVLNAFQANEITENQKNTLLANLDEISKNEQKASELIEKIAQQRVESIRRQVTGTQKEVDRIRRYNYQLEREQEQGGLFGGEAITRIIEEQTGDFLDFANERVRIEFGANRKIAEGARLLEAARLDATKFSDEQKRRVYDATFEFQQAVAKKLREADAKQIQDYIRIVQQALNAYADYIQQVEDLALQRITLEEQNFLKKLEEARENSLVNEKEYQQKRLEITEEYAAQRAAIEKKYRIRQLRLDQAQAIANGVLAVTRAYAEGGVVGILTGTIVAAATAAQLSALQQQIAFANSFKKGGMIKAQEGLIIQGPSHENGGVFLQNGGYNLEGGEAVINRVASRNYQGLLSQINQMGGGRPLVSSFDDSRIVDAIAKQKMEPIRAYVVEQDITRKQAVSKKLEQLSRF